MLQICSYPIAANQHLCFYFCVVMFLIRKTIILVLVVGLFCLNGQAQNEALVKGKITAEKYCGICHAYPSPSLLPRDIWTRRVLPQMAAFMGNKVAQDSLGVLAHKTEEELAVITELGVYPSSSMISNEDFQAIIDYYGAAAPEQLPAQTLKETPEPLHGFTTRTVFIEGLQSPKASLVAINEERSELIISDANAHQLYVKTVNDELFTLPSIASPAVEFIKKAPNIYDFITIGSIAPSDLSQGALYEMNLNIDTWNKVLDHLSRPVYGIWKDVENDGKPDFILCNFGHHAGNVSLYRDGNLDATPIQFGGAGARKVEVADLNDDGKQDIVVLFCQGNERISVFYNKGNGQFDFEKILLRFPPVMGSSYFELQDMNGDGKPDLLVSNGDNWDYSSVHKPYHGYRIYENKGNDTFTEAWCYPQYGAAKVMALDFDQDGDKDFASIAFYDELDNPQQQFLLFENKGNMTFKPLVLPDAALAKWLTMDVGDVDGDGDQDIVLGAYVHNTLEYTKLFMKGLEEIPSVLILENNKEH